MKNLILTMILITTITGCALNHTNPQDPYEAYNRKIFAFNMFVDKYTFRPLAKGYDFILPKPVKTGIGNVFSNIDELPTIGNDVLQGQVGWAIADFWRLFFNTTIGIGGLYDVSTYFGLKKRHQDLGMTFAKWGAKESPYIVIPFLGPSTVRDTVGYFIDTNTWYLYPYIDPWYLRWSIITVDFIHQRHEALPLDHLVTEALDPYTFMRHAYLQRRNFLIAQNQSKTVTTEGEGATQTDDEDTFVDDEDPYVEP